MKEEMKNYVKISDNENTMTQNIWDAAKTILRRKFFSSKILPQKIRKISNKQPKLTPKASRERRTKTTTTTKTKLVEEIIRIRGEINKIEMKKTTTMGLPWWHNG